MNIPQDTKLEQHVLSALITEPNSIIDVGFLTPKMFYDTRHQLIFQAFHHMWNEGCADYISVFKHLQSKGHDQKAGGMAYLGEILANTSSGIHIQHHARHLQELHMRRQVIALSAQLSHRAAQPTHDVFEVLSELDNISQSLNDTAALGGAVRHISYAVNDTFLELEKRVQIAKEGGVVGVPTGIIGFDTSNRGLQKSNLIILAARPGMGKTALALKFMLTAAQRKHKVCFFSLEMSKIELTQRLLLSLSYADSERIKSGRMTDEDGEQINTASAKLEKLPIHIDDTASTSISYIKNQARSLHKKGECDMVVIDYLQLMRPDEKKQIREQEVADMSRNAKILAKELDIPVVLLCQLSREVEKRGDKIPILSDLRESGAIEQDADVVLFVYRPEYYGCKMDEVGNSLIGAGKLIVAKNRHGATGDVNFSYNYNLTKFDHDIK